MSAPITGRICSLCLLKRRIPCFKALVNPIMKDGRCGFILTGSHDWNNNLKTMHFSQTHHRLLGTSSGNSNSANSLAGLSQVLSQTSSDPQTEITLPNDEGVLPKVNAAIGSPDQGRLFAVIHLAGKQYKVTADDIIVVTNYFAPEIGDRIRLEKVLLAGSKDFTLLGRPILNRDLVKVEAMVVEKTLSAPKVWFTYKARKGFRKLKLLQIHQTMLVINSIEVSPLAQDKN